MISISSSFFIRPTTVPRVPDHDFLYHRARDGSRENKNRGAAKKETVTGPVRLWSYGRIRDGTLSSQIQDPVLMRIFSMSGLCLLWLVLSSASRGQTPVFDRPQFHSASELALQGDATVTGGRLRLTPGEAGRVGGAWYFHKRVLAAGFETTFTFQLSGAGGGGGEGLAFVIQ